MNEHAQAPVPNRGNSLTLSWSLISIPVTVMKAIADVKSVPSRSMFTADGDPVGNQRINKITGQTVESDEIVKMAQASDGSWVPLTDDEIVDCTSGGPAKGVAAIETTVPLEALGVEYVIEASDFVRPALKKVGTKRVPDPAAEKAFALLLHSLEVEGKAALIKYASRVTAPKWAAITPDGRFHQLAFAGEVRVAPPMPQIDVSDDELKMGRQLVAAMDSGVPVLVDDAGDKVRAYVDAKASGEAVDVRQVDVASEPTVDLVAALAASLADTKPARKKSAAKKPARKSSAA